MHYIFHFQNRVLNRIILTLIDGNIFFGGIFLSNYIFIGIILDFYSNPTFFNQIISNSNLYWGHNIEYLLTLVCVVNFVIIWLVLLIANYYDLKFGIIPNKLSLILLAYGLAFNILLSSLLNTPYLLIFSMVLTAFVTLISFILGYIGFWGGGDFKLFVGLSLSLSFLDLNFLNLINIDYLGFLSYLPIFNQFIFYPKVFSILLNGILVAFISLSLVLIYDMAKNEKLKYYSILSILDFKLFFNQLSTKSIHIDELCEGMVLDKYYFENQDVLNTINAENNESNLYSSEDEGELYFSSLNRMGLTKHDIDLINDLYKKELIKNPNLQIKRGIPFIPFLTLGYFSFLVFGDFIFIISSLIRSLF